MNQLIRTIKVLSKQELKRVNQLLDQGLESGGLGYQDSTVFGVDHGPKTARIDQNIRSSSSFTIPPESEAHSIIHWGCNRALGEYRKQVKPFNPMFQYFPIPGSVETFFGSENYQVLRYGPGQKYDFHHDQADYQDSPYYFRTLSTVLYLNDDFEGGGTEFSHKTYKPKPGYALFFPSNWCYPHSGQEVLSGEKRVAVTWWYALREAAENP